MAAFDSLLLDPAAPTDTLTAPEARAIVRATLILTRAAFGTPARGTPDRRGSWLESSGSHAKRIDASDIATLPLLAARRAAATAEPLLGGMALDTIAR